MYVDTGAETGSGVDNLHVGTASRHRLDSLNTSNDSLKKVVLLFHFKLNPQLIQLSYKTY